MLEYLRWIARDVGTGGEAADPWATGGSGTARSAVDVLRAYRWVTIVDEVILSLTILGSLAILGSMFLLEFNGRPATTRTRIVQSLVLSDLILGFVGIVGTSIVLSGTPLVNGTNTCSGLGYCLTVVLWTEHLWTLILAIATYLILIYPLHPATLWLERRWYYLWILVWVLAAGIGLIGYFLYGFFPNGGICYYGANSGLYGELIQFLPRACVMLMISILYARLFVFLRRPDRIRASFSDGSQTGRTDTSPGIRGRSKHLFRSAALSDMLSRGRKGSKDSDVFVKGQGDPITEKEGVQNGTTQPVQDGQSRSRSRSGTRDRRESQSGANTPGAFRVRTPPSTPDEPAPWEQVQLPIFHVDGERFGGREAGGGPSGGGLHRETSSIWSGWKGLGKAEKERDRVPRRPRPSTTSSTSPPMSSQSRLDSTSSHPTDYPASPKSAASVAVFPPTIEVDLDTPPLERDADPDRTPQPRYQAGDVWQTPGDNHAGRQGSVSSSLGGRAERLRKPSAISAFSYHVSEAPDSSTIHSNPSHSGSRRNSAYPDQQSLDHVAEGGEKGVTAGNPFDRASYPRANTTQKLRSQDEAEMEELDDEGEGDDDMDLMRMLQASEPPGGGTRSYQEGEQVELVEESMASYLNRKTALLMLWFPLGYCLLFSVSLIRIIYDFVDSPPIELRALSRWFIFSQGILDALIYGLVEWHTKRVVRRRVRKGTFNTPLASRQGTGSGIGGAMRAMSQGSKNLFSSRGGSVQAGVNMVTSGGSIPATDRYMGRLNGQTMSRSSNRTPTTSYIPPIPEGMSIEEQLEEDADRAGYTDRVRKAGSGSGSGSGSGFELEEDSTRKGSIGSEAKKSSLEEDGRGRERRKDN